MALQDFESQRHVPYELATSRVAQPSRGRQLLGLPDVVEQRSRNQPVTVQPWIVLRHFLGQFTQTEGMLEKPAAARVMQLRAAGSCPEGAGRRFVVQNRLQYRPQLRISYRLNKARQRRKHIVWVLRRRRAEITLLELALFAPPDPLDDQLRPLVVELNRAAHLHDVVAVE